MKLLALASSLVTESQRRNYSGRHRTGTARDDSAGLGNRWRIRVCRAGLQLGLEYLLRELKAEAGQNGARFAARDTADSIWRKPLDLKISPQP